MTRPSPVVHWHHSKHLAAIIAWVYGRRKIRSLPYLVAAKVL